MKNEENEINNKIKNSRLKYLKLLRITILLPIIIVIVWGIVIGNILIVVSAIALSFIVSYPFKRAISKECKIKDEREYYISEKASRQTLFITTILGIYTGVILDTISNQNPQYKIAGITLNIAVLVVIIIYAVLYTYNKRKYGN